MSLVATEHVLVVPTEVFHKLGHFQGFCGDTERYLKGLLDPAHTSYRPRAEMEQDPSFKQLIPYVIFRYRDAAGQTMLFQYTRGKGQGEARLHAKRSVGVGGHISVDDTAEPSAYEGGMRREWGEGGAGETEAGGLRVNEEVVPLDRGPDQRADEDASFLESFRVRRR